MATAKFERVDVKHDWHEVAAVHDWDRINQRYQRSPYAAPWDPNGTIPDAGLLIHCFDGQEDANALWQPSGGHRTRDDLGHGSNLLSTSFVFSLQNYNLDGTPNGLTITESLFGHGCTGGGLIFAPNVTKIACGNGYDCGARCHEFCPPTTAETPLDGPKCSDSWAPADLQTYLYRETQDYRRGCQGSIRAMGCHGHYNEFEIDGIWWYEHLPLVIDAFIGGASEAHCQFLTRYRLEVSPEDVALLHVTADRDNPFKPAVNHDGSPVTCPPPG